MWNSLVTRRLFIVVSVLVQTMWLNIILIRTHSLPSFDKKWYSNRHAYYCLGTKVARRCESNKNGSIHIKKYLSAFVQPLLQWKSNKFFIYWMCVCKPSNPASKAHAPHYMGICSLLGCTIFFHIVSQHDFQENVMEHTMCVLTFSTTFVCSVSHSKKNWAIYDQKCIFKSM
jgi:hypothetical protein